MGNYVPIIYHLIINYLSITSIVTQEHALSRFLLKVRLSPTKKNYLFASMIDLQS